MKSVFLRKLILIILLFGFLLPVFSAALILPQEVFAQGAAPRPQVTVGNQGQAALQDEFSKMGCSSSLMTLLKLNFDCVILNIIWTFDNFLLGTLLDWAVKFFDWSVQKNLGNVAGSIFVTTGWSIIRDITNLFFIFVLLWIALATIFNIPRYGAKDLLATLIIAALLINFSLAIGGFFIKFSNALAQSFWDAVKARGSVTLQMLDFTNIQKFSTQPLTPRSPKAICNDEALQEYPPSDTGIESPEITAARSRVEQACLGREDMVGLQEAWERTDAKIKDAIYIALWLIVIIPIIIFVFLAGAVLLLIRYLQLSMLLVFSPIVFFFWILPDTRHIWSDWWNRLIKQSFFAPAFLFLLFLTITTFNVWSGRTIVSSGTNAATIAGAAGPKEPPLLKTASIGGLGTGLGTQEALAQAAPTPTTQSRGFFAIGFEMILFVALMIMNLMVAQQMGIKFAGTVTGWGNRTARWGGRKVRGMAYRQAIRAGTGAARGVTESAVGRWMARTPGARALLTPAVAIQKQREAIDADRAKRVAELAQVSPVAAAERLQGESMAVKAAFAKSASPDAMKKLISQMDAPVQEEFVRQLQQNQDRYRIEDLDKKVGEAMAKDPRGLTLRTVAKTGKRSSDADFQSATFDYLDSLDNQELAKAITAEAIEQDPTKDPTVMNYIIERFKDEQRIGMAVLGNPKKITAFFNLMEKNLATASLTDPTLSGKNPIDYFAETMRSKNPIGANDLTSTPILAVIAGSGAQPFTQRRRRLPVGACCLPTGHCIVTTSADCSAQGGSFMGVGIPCTPGLCTPGTPPAPPATPPTPPTPPGPLLPTPPGPPTAVPPPPTPPTPPAPPGGLPSAATAGLRRRGLPPLPSPPTPPPPAPQTAPSAGLPSALEAALKRRFPPSPASPTMPPTPATPPSKPATPTPTAGTATSPATPTTRTPRQKIVEAPPKADPNDLAAFSRNLAAALNERVANQLTPLVENMDKVNAAVAALSQEVSQGTLNSENARGAIRTLTQEIKDMRPRGAIQNDNREALTKIIARIRRIEETSRSIAESLGASDENADKETTSLLRGLHDASQLTRLALARKRELLSS